MHRRRLPTRSPPTESRARILPPSGDILESAFGGELVSTGAVPTREKRAEVPDLVKPWERINCRQHGNRCLVNR